jgi:hypothetical protein
MPLGEVVYLAQHPKFAKHIGKGVIDSLKKNGRVATTDRYAAFWVSSQQTRFWEIVNQTVRGYLAHSKFKPKD